MEGGSGRTDEKREKQKFCFKTYVISDQTIGHGVSYNTSQIKGK
jgi:hypothetical protein